MELKLVDGQYASDGLGGFEVVTDASEQLQRALFLLTARRGGFSPLPELGSRLYTLPRIKRAERAAAARQFAAEALKGEPVSIDDVSVIEADGGVNIRVCLSASGKSAEATISIL